MAIYVGNSHPTGGTDVYIGSFTPNIYIGSFLTYPEANIRYVFRNGALHYSSGSNLYASGSNYAWYAADVLMYNGSTFVSSAANVTLTATRVSGDTAFHINANNEVYADNRTNVTGSTRTATFRASYGDTTAATFTVTQAANNKFTRQETLGLTAYTSNNYYYGGGDYYIPCTRGYAYWDYYTSGYQGSTSTTSTLVSAMTYDTGSCSWLSSAATESVGWPRKLVMDYNYATGPTGNRSATITVKYPVNGDYSDTNYVTASTEITQFGANYSAFEYGFSRLTVSQNTWAANVSGTGYTANVEVMAQYRQTIHSGITGTTNWGSSTGNWITYTGRPDLCGNVAPSGMTNGYHFYFLENGQTQGYPVGELYYPTTATTYGTIRVYPTQVNGGSEAVTQEMNIVFGNASTAFTLTHNANISISVSPSTLSPASTGATNVFTVTSNVQGWTIGVSDSSWITATTSSGNLVQVKTAQNTSPASRTGYVYVKYAGSTAATCTINQAAMSYTFSAVTSTTPRVNANSTSVVLAIKSLQGASAFPFTTNNASILTNNIGLAISNVTTGSETGLYYLNLTCTQNSSTALSRTASVIVRQPSPSVNTLTFYITQNPASSSSVDVPGVEKLFDLGDGWIVGRVCTSVGQPNDTHYYGLYYARNDAGVNTTFSATGKYQIHVNGGSPSDYNIPTPLNYTSGHQINTTDYQGNPVSFYGWNFGGGPNATTNANMAGITYTT